MRTTTKLLAAFTTLTLSVPRQAQHLRLPNIPHHPAPAAHHAHDTLNPFAFSAPFPPPAAPGFGPGIQFGGAGPNFAGQGAYQAPNAWNAGVQYAAPPRPSGDQFSQAFLGRGPGGQYGGYQFGQVGNGQASNIGVQGMYQGPNAWSGGMGGYTSGPNGSQFTNGGFSRGPNGYTSTFGVTQVDPQGQATTRGGTMTYQNPSNWGLGTTYVGPDGRTYTVGSSQNNGITTVGAQGSAPGALPGTRVSGGGDVTFRGPNTVVRGGGTVTDASGLVRLGGGNGQADRHGITSISDAGLGNVRGTQTQDVRFRGGDSSYSQRTQGTIPGIGTAQQSFSVSGRGVSANMGMSIGGTSYSVGGGFR